MNFEERILKLCALAVACQTEKEAVALTRELRMLLHERMEQLRSDMAAINPAFVSTSESIETETDRSPATPFPQ